MLISLGWDGKGFNPFFYVFFWGEGVKLVKRIVFCRNEASQRFLPWAPTPGLLCGSSLGLLWFLDKGFEDGT